MHLRRSPLFLVLIACLLLVTNALPAQASSFSHQSKSGVWHGTKGSHRDGVVDVFAEVLHGNTSIIRVAVLRKRANGTWRRFGRTTCTTTDHCLTQKSDVNNECRFRSLTHVPDLRLKKHIMRACL